VSYQDSMCSVSTSASEVRPAHGPVVVSVVTPPSAAKELLPVVAVSTTTAAKSPSFTACSPLSTRSLTLSTSNSARSQPSFHLSQTQDGSLTTRTSEDFWAISAEAGQLATEGDPNLEAAIAAVRSRALESGLKKAMSSDNLKLEMSKLEKAQERQMNWLKAAMNGKIQYVKKMENRIQALDDETTKRERIVAERRVSAKQLAEQKARKHDERCRTATVRFQEHLDNHHTRLVEKQSEGERRYQERLAEEKAKREEELKERANKNQERIHATCISARQLRQERTINVFEKIIAKDYKQNIIEEQKRQLHERRREARDDVHRRFSVACTESFQLEKDRSFNSAIIEANVRELLSAEMGSAHASMNAEAANVAA